MGKFEFCGAPDCYFVPGTYQNGNTALRIFSDTEGPMCTVTVNTGVKLPMNQVAIKNWSENGGIESVLKNLDIIESTRIGIIPCGYANAPVYNLTDNGVALIINQ